MTSPAVHRPTAVLNNPSVKIAAAYGRLYVSGPHARLVSRLPGATEHERSGAYQLSLTLETLRAIRQALGVSKEQMARFCTAEVLRWAKAAGQVEQQMLALHRKLSEGYRRPLPWYDAQGMRPAFDHQKVMATVACELDGAAFLCEMGTGKTRAAVESMREKYRLDAIEVALVVCPKGVMNTWEREIALWSEGLHVVKLRGPVKDRRRVIESVARQGNEARFERLVLILNYDALAELKGSLIALMGERRVGLVLDEMHKIKNPQAQVTQAAMEVGRHAAWRLGMTGTPIANGKAEEIWSQWYFVDLGVTFGANFVQFRREFFTENDYTWTLEPHEETYDTIGQRMRLRGVRYRKEDCLDLPPKVYELAEVEMTAEQARAYEEMREWLIAWLREHDGIEPGDADEDTGEASTRHAATAANQLVAIMRLTQITSGFLPTESGTTHFFQPNPKLDRLEEIVREQVADGRSVIVWAQYRNDVQAIMERFADLQPARIDGTQQGTRGEAERAEAERRFQAGETPLLVGNPAAGGVGLNLQRASVAIYYSLSYSLTDRMQSEDRCHRSGSEAHNRVTYVDIVCTGTIDEVVREALASKKQVADAVVDLRRAIGV
jgi:SNF2 family DNA or RNA helicase